MSLDSLVLILPFSIDIYQSFIIHFYYITPVVGTRLALDLSNHFNYFIPLILLFHSARNKMYLRRWVVPSKTNREDEMDLSRDMFWTWRGMTEDHIIFVEMENRSIQARRTFNVINVLQFHLIISRSNTLYLDIPAKLHSFYRINL